ncbi:MAG: hypothetical protein ACYTCU_01315 [Planctomycetota bacterium]
MRNPILMVVLVAALSVSLGGCWAVTPQLDPHDPPPNVPEGMLLLQLSEALIESMAEAEVLADRDRVLATDGDDVGAYAENPERVRQILGHQVVTGMTAQEVIWAFGCHPSRTRDQGPPGSHTLLWEVPRSLEFGSASVGAIENGTGHGNYWVRFDETGRVAAAGRN